MVAPIENIVEALDSEKHSLLQNQVGQELSNRLRLYENEIRSTGSINNLRNFTEDVKGALKNVLDKHVKITSVSGGITALAEAITDDIYRQNFGFSANSVEQGLRSNRISNYDDFSYNFVKSSRDSLVTQLLRYGQEGIQGYLQDPTLRQSFFNQTGNKFPIFAGVPMYSWTDHAKKESMDVGGITQILSSAVSKTISPKLSEDHPTLLKYSGNL